MTAKTPASRALPIATALLLAVAASAALFYFAPEIVQAQGAPADEVSKSKPAGTATDAKTGKPIKAEWRAVEDSDLAGEIIIETPVGLEEDGIPIYGEVTDFMMTESSGRTVSKADLAGKVWVADFIFTRCAGPCPVMTQGLRRLQEVLPEDGGIKLVSFTVDPDYDTAKVLHDYAVKYEANPKLWWFLRGGYDETQHLAQDSLMVSMGREGAWVDEQGNVVKAASAEEAASKAEAEEAEKAAANAQEGASEGLKVTKRKFVATAIMHSEKYILIDHRGRIRGYYDGTAEDTTDTLNYDIARLLIVRDRDLAAGETTEASKPE